MKGPLLFPGYTVLFSTTAGISGKVWWPALSTSSAEGALTTGGYVSPEVSGTKKNRVVLYLIKLFLGMGFPVHKPYPYSLHIYVRIPPF